MEEVAAAGMDTGSQRDGGNRRWAAVFLGCCIALPGWAQEAQAEPQDVVLAQARVEVPMHLELNTSTLPRLDAQEAGAQGPRLDLSVLPASGSGLGMAVGMNGFASRPAGFPGSYAASRPSVDIGLHWRLHGRHRIDVTAWRRMDSERDAYTQILMREEPVYGARVEMKLKPVRKAGLNLERGFLGMQLQSGAKISIKRRHGGPMIYYRNTF